MPVYEQANQQLRLKQARKPTDSGIAKFVQLMGDLIGANDPQPITPLAAATPQYLKATLKSAAKPFGWGDRESIMGTLRRYLPETADELATHQSLRNVTKLPSARPRNINQVVDIMGGLDKTLMKPGVDPRDYENYDRLLAMLRELEQLNPPGGR